MPAKSQRGTDRPRGAEPSARRAPLDWDDVRVLLALQRKRTLRGAAEQLRVNASTVSRRLEALEAALAARLFDRSKDGFAPTAAAEQLLAHAERVEQAALGLAAAAEGFEREPEGVVRITAPPGVADYFIAPAIGRLLARHPALRIELDASIGYSDLTRREADLALRTSRPESGDLVAVKLIEEPDAILGAPGYVHELGRIERFADARWLGWGHELAQLPSARFLADRVPESAIVLRSNSINALLSAAESGLGLVLLSDNFARIRPLAEARFTAKLEKERAHLPSLALWLVGHRALRDVPRIAAVWAFILEEIGHERERSARKRKPI